MFQDIPKGLFASPLYSGLISGIGFYHRIIRLHCQNVLFYCPKGFHSKHHSRTISQLIYGDCFRLQQPVSSQKRIRLPHQKWVERKSSNSRPGIRFLSHLWPRTVKRFEWYICNYLLTKVVNEGLFVTFLKNSLTLLSFRLEGDNPLVEIGPECLALNSNLKHGKWIEGIPRYLCAAKR